jgi:hypothetical protein
MKFNEKQTPAHNAGYTSGGFQSNLQAPGSLARAVTVDKEVPPLLSIYLPLAVIVKDSERHNLKD